LGTPDRKKKKKRRGKIIYQVQDRVGRLSKPRKEESPVPAGRKKPVTTTHRPKGGKSGVVFENGKAVIQGTTREGGVVLEKKTYKFRGGNAGKKKKKQNPTKNKKKKNKTQKKKKKTNKKQKSCIKSYSPEGV